jgi:O-antigen/teichoic acid export membrane protein
MMVGVLVGLVVATVMAVWQSRHLWLARSLPFDWRGLLRQALPLLLGAGAVQFLFTADTIFVKSYFPKAVVGFYASVGTLSRAVMWVVGPLVAVVFPRIVHSTARSEKTDFMGIVLGGTLILTVVGSVGLVVMGPLVVKFIYDKTYVPVAISLFPWYAAAMVPLALANVLVNFLFAKSSFRVVPALCVLAVGYGYALTRFHATQVMVLQTMGVCNLVLLAIGAWYTWGVAKTGGAKAEGGTVV